ncbi:MAG: class I SAM-dependent methyltransferase [Rhodospirillales bacterium]|uniref:class I SAM-dependent methyltransferase n=1 Tax=Thalassospira sp. 11-3 TaxID=2135614 RepID=UPI000D7644CC|nr:class I SAM-dependent methyltransferase [Thalassospira sp. 11-3]MBL4840284.1 class I SAM-dependent methyltransferase [Thalassospira sp.]MBR9779868.1 class I SAM-dependent methyltransferase [Rhodospirillales bacterium]MBR9818628.1 class I SAM-dependent methyltransferase [Rhodospirillales bacterium]PXX30943.1 SAM-dependent MidA family methyltransferase [Thalassospira sp. 11-3]
MTETSENPLLDHLKRRIALGGPITIADFMSDALAHPEHGYYRKQDPFGRKGDFITAPEISQMFGELIGLWAAVTWQQMGSPRKINLVELGPGRGTLMADALRAVRNVPGLSDALTVRFVETSPVLRTHQQTAIMPYGIPATWHEAFDDIPVSGNAPMIVIGNEFFDALPIRQFERASHGWSERLVGVDANTGELGFVRGAQTPVTDALVPATLRGTAKPGDIFESCPAAIAIADQVARRLNEVGGAALFIDYGHPHSAFGDTLQALKDHKYHPVLEQPGDADLTAHVDFAAIGRAMLEVDARIGAVLTQGTFLRMLGIEQRAELLKEGADDVQAKSIDAALARLIDADQMGTLFKVLIGYGRETASPPCVSGAEG